MTSQKSSEKLYTVSTFTGLIDQVRDVREQLDGLKIGHSVLECTIGCLSGETIMIEESLSCIQEHCIENKDITRRDPDLVGDINLTLFATSVSLSDVLEDAKNKSLDSISSRPSRVSRLLMSSDAKLRKYDGIDSFLQRLLVCSSALRVLYRMIDPFERRCLDKQGLSRYINSIISKLGIEMARRLGRPPSPPDYVRSLWPEHSIVYPLTSELISRGLSQQQVQNIYQMSNQKSFVVKHTLKRWRSYGSEDDYRVALIFLARNGYDVETTDHVLTVLSSHGKDIYGDLLKALQKASYEYKQVMRWLSELLDLVGLGQEEASPEGSTGEGDILRHLHNAIVVKNYDFKAICGDLAFLRSLNKARQPLVASARFSPVLYLRTWEDHGYNLSKIPQRAEALRLFAARMMIEWNRVDALLALCDYSFDIAAIAVELNWIHHSKNSWAFVTIVQTNIRFHPMPEILSAVRGMSMKMHISWRYDGIDQMASQCSHNLDKMLDMQMQLEAAFPAPFVETNFCWDWLAFNNFYLVMTLKDASNIPPGFLSWSAEDKRGYISGMRRATGERLQVLNAIPGCVFIR